VGAGVGLEGLEEGRREREGVREGPEGAVVGKAVRPKGGNFTGYLMKGPPTDGEGDGLVEETNNKPFGLIHFCSTAVQRL